MKKLLVALAWLGFASSMSAALAGEKFTTQTLIDRAQITDLITRYYNNFGREDAENFADFYAGDAELITRGKEWGTFVKVKGDWRYKTRQIKGGTEAPEGWRE